MLHLVVLCAIMKFSLEDINNKSTYLVILNRYEHVDTINDHCLLAVYPCVQ